MRPYIGQYTCYENAAVWVQDIDCLQGTALVGEVDVDGMVFDPIWVDWDDLNLGK